MKSQWIRSAGVVLTIAAVGISLVGCASNERLVPDLRSSTVREGRAAVEDLDLTVEAEDASAKRRAIWSSDNWTVIDQVPVAGTPVEKDSSVKLRALKKDEVVDGHAKPVLVPDLGRMSLATASRHAEDLGLVPRIIDTATDQSMKPQGGYQVASQDPSPGHTAPVGSEIHIRATQQTPFNPDMVRARGVTKEVKGGQSNVRFVAGTSDLHDLHRVAEECVDYFLGQTKAAYCFAYSTDAAYEVKHPDWTAESDDGIWLNGRPCWSVYGGQALNGPNTRSFSEGAGSTSACPR